MSEDPMDRPPVDHGSDRYNYVELQNAPEGVAPPDNWVDHLLATSCLDCNPNLFIEWRGTASHHDAVNGKYDVPPGEWVDINDNRWAVTVAHDETCPNPNIPKDEH